MPESCDKCKSKFGIEAIYLAEFDIHAGPLIKHLKTIENPLLENLIKKNFEEWKEFIVPDEELCNKYVRVYINEKFSVCSFAVQEKSDKYERKKLVFNIGLVLKNNILCCYEKSVKKNLKKLTLYLLNLEFSESFISGKNEIELKNMIELIFERLKEDDKLILINNNSLCYLYFNKKKVKKEFSINDKKIFKTIFLENLEEFYEKDYFEYLVVKNIENSSLVSEVIFKFDDEVKKIKLSKKEFLVKNWDIKDRIKFVYEFLYRLKKEKKIFLVGKIETNQYYILKKNNDFNQVKIFKKYFFEFQKFLKELNIIFSFEKEDFKILFKSLINIFDGERTFCELIQFMHKNEKLVNFNKKDLNEFFNYFIYFGLLKKILKKKKEYFFKLNIDPNQIQKLFVLKEISKKIISWIDFRVFLEDIGKNIMKKKDILQKYKIKEDQFTYIVELFQINKIYF